MLTQAEDVVVRINGTGAITKTVIPVAAAQSGLLTKDVARIDVADYSVTLQGFGGRVKTWASDIKLRFPIESNDLTAAFKAAANNKARVDSTYNFDKGNLKLKFHVRSTPKSPLGSLVPAFVKQYLQVKDTFNIELDGVSGQLNFTARKTGTGAEIETVNSFTVQLTKVSVSDTAGLTKIANALLGLNRLFNVTGANSVNQAATKLVNKILKSDLGLETRVKGVANEAMKKVTSAQFAMQPIAVAPASKIVFSTSFQSMRSRSNDAKSEWRIGMAASPGNQVPGLPFETPVRPAETIDQVPAAGDLQVFVPYSLIDKGMYEALQAGILKTIDVPSAANGGVGAGFKMHLTPTETPRSRRDPSNPSQILLEFAAKMEDTTVATINPIPPGGLPRPGSINVRTVNGSAKVTVVCRLGSNALSGVFVDILSVTLDNLSGQLRAGVAVTNLANFRPALQTVITNALQARMPRLTLMARTVTISAPLQAQAGIPSAGNRYIRLPISIVRT